MAEKRLDTRIQQKHDIQSNWEKAVNFIPKAGEIIIYDVDANYAYPRIKIGNGTNYLRDLLFANEQDNFFIEFNEISTEDESILMASKTFEQLVDAYLKNRMAYGIIAGNTFLPLNQLTPEKAIFRSIIDDSESYEIASIIFDSSNNVSIDIFTIPEIDASLQKSGFAADAAAVGLALGEINNKLNTKVSVNLDKGTLIFTT